MRKDFDPDVHPDDEPGIPFGVPVYESMPEPRAMVIGTAYQRYFKHPQKGKKMRRIGFRAPHSRKGEDE